MAIDQRDGFWNCLGKFSGGLGALAVAAAFVASGACGSSDSKADAGPDSQTAQGGAGGGAGSGGGAGADAGGAGGADAGAGAGGAGASDAGGADASDAEAPTTPLGEHCTGCTKMPIGNPTWEPTGAVVMAGTVGSGSSAALDAWLTPLLAPNHRFQGEFIVPAVVHAGPYNEEPYAMVTAGGVTPKQDLTAAEYTAPAGVVVLINLVPAAGASQGSSFDFVSGPIISNAAFPLHVTGSILRNEAAYDSFGTVANPISFLGFDQINPKVPGDGPSHYILHFGENTAAVPGVPADGSYSFQFRLTDNSLTATGWTIVIPFTVSP